MAMIKKVGGLAAVSRIMTGLAAVTADGSSLFHGVVREAPFRSNDCGFSAQSQGIYGHWLVNNFGKSTRFTVHDVSGVRSFASAASSPKVQEKETLQSSEYIPQDVVLYQYEACPFCNKVRAFLDYYDIPYKVVEVNPITKKEIKWSDYKKVPILMVDGEKMVDSSDIIDKLSERIHPEITAGCYPGCDEDKKWRLWVDGHLVHVLSPNIYRTASEALESFDYITSQGNFTLTERIIAKYAGAAAMYFVSKKLKKKHNIMDERTALYEAAETWVAALKGREFLGTSKPNLADLSVFGVLRPIRYLMSGTDMVENTRIGEWYTRMERIVGTPSRINA